MQVIELIFNKKKMVPHGTVNGTLYRTFKENNKYSRKVLSSNTFILLLGENIQTYHLCLFYTCIYLFYIIYLVFLSFLVITMAGGLPRAFLLFAFFVSFCSCYDGDALDATGCPKVQNTLLGFFFIFIVVIII